MTGQKRNKVVTAVAVLLMALAVFLTVMLFVGDGDDEKSSTKKAADIAVTAETSTESDEYTTTAPAKYLWEYGHDNEKFEKPSEMK